LTTERIKSQFEHACAYLQQGWHLVFMPDGTKAPCTADWNTPAQLVTTPAQAIDKLKNGPQNMGLCHQYSRTMALDIDHLEHARTLFSELGLDLDSIVDQGMRIKSRAGRDKVIFACPQEMGGRKAINWPAEHPDPDKKNDKFCVFELRTGGTQDVLPPSLHPDTGLNYEWVAGRAPWDFKTAPMMPLDLLALWHAINDRSSGILEEMQKLCPWRKVAPGKTYVLRVRKVDAGNQDVIGQFNAANSIGDLLERAGYKRKGRRYLAPSSSTTIPGVVVLEDRCYSHHGSDVLADGYAHDAFDLLTTLYHNGDLSAAIKDAAEQLGIGKDTPRVDMKIDMAALIANIEKRQAAAERPEAVDHETGEVKLRRVDPKASTGIRTPVPELLLNPPGFVGEWVQWVEDHSQFPQRLLAVAAGLALGGALLGRKVMSETGLRTNVYLVGIAKTGRGKEMARTAVKNTLVAAGLSDLLGGEEFASAQGLHNRVARCPATLFTPDEFGKTLKALTGDNAQGWEAGIITTLMKLYSSTASIVQGSERADQKLNKRIDIEYPCVSLYGTTTPEPFYEALSGGDVASGWLNRMLVLHAPDERVQYRNVLMGHPPDKLVAWCKAARAMSDGLIGTGGNAIMVKMDGMSESLFTNFRAEIDTRVDSLEAEPMTASMAALWARAWEQAVKISLILSVGMVPSEELQHCDFEISYRCSEWAIAFVRHFLGAMQDEISERVGESELDRANQDVLRLIRKAGSFGLTVSDLKEASRSFRKLAEKKRQEGLLATLQYHDSVFQITFKTAGRPRVAWVSTEFRDELEAAASPDTAA
jgi:hypothetical protein